MCIPMPENKALKEYKKNTNNNDNYFNSVNSLQFNDAFKNKLKEVTADDKLSENEVSTVLCTYSILSIRHLVLNKRSVARKMFKFRVNYVPNRCS